MTQLSLDIQAGISGGKKRGESPEQKEKVEVRGIPLEGEVSIKGRPWEGQGRMGQGMSTC